MQQCMVRLVDYTVLCSFQKFLEFLIPFCLLLILMVMGEAVLVHGGGRMNNGDDCMFVCLCVCVPVCICWHVLICT